MQVHWLSNTHMHVHRRTDSATPPALEVPRLGCVSGREPGRRRHAHERLRVVAVHRLGDGEEKVGDAARVGPVLAFRAIRRASRLVRPATVPSGAPAPKPPSSRTPPVRFRAHPR